MMFQVNQPEGSSSSNSNKLGECCSWKEQQKEIAKQISLSQAHKEGIHPRLLLALFDEESITVYQAYKPSIGEQAARQGNFCNSEFSFSRMTWIKPNFTWMMYRSGWATKPNQETILAIRLRRKYFDQLVCQAVPALYSQAESYETEEQWHVAVRKSHVVVQWDPDHHMHSATKMPYRVIQLGLRKKALEGFKGPGILTITDISDEVRALRSQIISKTKGHKDWCNDATPLETLYTPAAQTIQ